MAGIIDKFRLDGKKAIVTGGARGLGNGIASGFYEAGATVLLLDILPEVHEAAAEMDKSRVLALQADLQGKEQIQNACTKAVEMLGGADILVNAAGVQHRKNAAEFPYEEWCRVIDINLTSLFFMCQCIGNVMLKNGSGRIINIASLLSFLGGVTIPAYAASKGGVAQLTKALSNEWAKEGVCVNAIAPGYMETELTATMREFPEQIRDINARIPMGRWGNPEDLQGVCVFLASEASSYVSGSIITIDGGYLCR